jgi:hypothetical protein
MRRVRNQRQEALDRRARLAARRVGLRAKKRRDGFTLEDDFSGRVVDRALSAEEVLECCRGP